MPIFHIARRCVWATPRTQTEATISMSMRAAKEIAAALVMTAVLGGSIACEIEDDSPPTQTPDPTERARTATPAPETPTSTPPPTRVSTPTTAPTAEVITYVVRSGDVCWRIAQQFGVSTVELLEANPRIDPDCRNLRVGWELTIPTVGAAAGSRSTAGTAAGDPEPTQERAPDPTPELLRVPQEKIEDCLDPWDGNHNGFEDQIRPLLNDEDSMETHETRFGLDEYVSDHVPIVMVYSAKNAYGGRVKATATGLLNYKTCKVTVVLTGLE
ncbi:MAG: LysM peptidoglycan-binding domain-containing protein [Dehalococcoidia bacterium]|nr:LysM peptidoglycan-binding domain-containing protein [Dehalococcoidia bacterium]